METYFKLKKSSWALVLFIFILSGNSYSQSTIEGRVLAKQNQSPIPYAHILNHTTGLGTIANTDGFFRMDVAGPNDSITVSAIGFQSLRLPTPLSSNEIVVRMRSNSFELGEVVLEARDDSYLYKLIRDAAKGAFRGEKTSKAYYELRSFKNDFQTELVEAYYNANLGGYGLSDLKYKIGRVGLRAVNFGYSVSVESSKAMLLLDIAGGSSLFPDTPIELGKSRMKKRFYLELESRYKNADNDSIFVIKYYPKDTTEAFFSGVIWVNKTQASLLKVVMNCEECGVSPFVPLVGTQTIERVDMSITQVFDSYSSSGAILKSINFDYVITYDLAGRTNAGPESTVHTQALMYFYDYDNPFFVPRFEFQPNLSDYRKVSVMPYDDFFWNNHDEYQMSTSDNRNDKFYSNPATEGVDDVFSTGVLTWSDGFFEGAFRRWSEKRLVFRPDSSRPEAMPPGGIIADKYEIAVQHFLDVNRYNDSIDIKTAVVFDPYKSFYDLPVDNQTLAFINIYFDLCEITRLELHRKISAVKEDQEEIERVYAEFREKFDEFSRSFFREVDRGTNEEAMRRYNATVLEKLGIDNIELFEIYGEPTD